MPGPLACLLVVAGFFCLLFAVHRASRLLRLGAETRRKIVHMGTGCVALSFPWLFPSALWFLACMGAMLAALMALRLLPSERRSCGVLHGVERRSLGDIWFLAAVIALYFLSQGTPALYVIPLAVITLSDALAALVGVRHGRSTYATHGGMKSWEGTIVCFASALPVILCLLVTLAGMPLPAALLVALNLAVIGALVEGMAWDGLDNILLPLALHSLLAGFLDLQAADGSQIVGLASLIVLTLLAGVAASAVRLRILRTDTAMTAMVFAYVFWAAGGVPALAVCMTALGLYAALPDSRQRSLMPAVDGRCVALLCAPAALMAVLVQRGLMPDDAVILCAAIIIPVVLGAAARRRNPRTSCGILMTGRKRALGGRREVARRAPQG